MLQKGRRVRQTVDTMLCDLLEIVCDRVMAIDSVANNHFRHYGGSCLRPLHFSFAIFSSLYHKLSYIVRVRSV